MYTALANCVQYSLENFLYDNATFMAERIWAEDKSELSRHLLATCYYSDKKYNASYQILQDSTSERNKYLLALSALRLGKIQEAEFALTGGKNISTTVIPNDAVGLHLLGTICKKQNQRERAAFCFKKSLEVNPFLWCSYQSLCEIGEDVAAEEYFGTESDANLPSIPEASKTVAPPLQAKERGGKEPAAPPRAPRQESRARTCISTPQLAGRIVQRLYNSPMVVQSREEASLHNFKLHSNVLFGLNDTKSNVRAPSQTPNMSEESVPPPSLSAPDTSLATPTFKNMPPPIRGKGKVSRSRISQATPTSSSRDIKVRGSDLFQDLDSEPGPFSRDSKMTPIQPKPPQFLTQTPQYDLSTPQARPIKTLSFSATTNSTAEETTAEESSLFSGEEEEDMTKGSIMGTAQVLTLLRVMGNGLRHLHRFKCKQAIHEFKKLSTSQYQTGWVLCRVGRAHVELVDYMSARKVFEKVREMEPYRTDHMELYSTVLWQLKDSVALSYLAHQLIELDKHSPETWCAVGNCFSLQKEHETAVKFFDRAASVNPSFSYAHTLSGHEYIASDNWDKALACFRTAISLDERHYNAWYGLGMIYFRQEKYPNAYYHFSKALAINNRSSVLYCYLGMVLRATKSFDDALVMLESAIKIDPKNTLAKYKKAAVLVNLTRYEEALQELERLQDFAPREAPLYFLMGKILKKQGEHSKALDCFTVALDFDTKSTLSRSIKAAINKLGIPDEDDDIEAERDDDVDLGDLS